MNEAMKNAAMNERNLDVLRKLAADNGMNTLWDSCRSLVIKGVTSIQELMYLNAE